MTQLIMDLDRTMNKKWNRKRIVCSAIPALLTWLLPIAAALYCYQNGIPAWPDPVKYLLLLFLFLVLAAFELFYFHLLRTRQGSLYAYLLAAPHAFVLTQMALFGNLSNWPLSVLVCVIFFGMDLVFGYISKRETGHLCGYNEFLIHCLMFDAEAVCIVLGEYFLR